MTGTDQTVTDQVTSEPETQILDSHVGGRWLGGSAQPYLAANPASPDRIVATVRQADRAILDLALAAATEAAQGWALLPAGQRGARLYTAADLLDERAPLIGRDIAREMGKTLAESIAETRRAAAVFRYYAGQTLEPDGETYPASTAGTLLFSRRVPLGVVAVISPWNFPIAIPAWKLAPALAYGNTVVWKPAELTPLTSVHLTTALIDAGLPDGVLNLVLGRGRDLGDPLVGDRRVQAVTFTGSNVTGNRVRDLATSSGKRVQLELGGKNPAVVLADADLSFAAGSIARAAFLTSGQKCTATSRVIVQEEVAEEFGLLLAAEADAMSIGDPLDPHVQVGPLASAAQLDTVSGYLRQGRAQGRLLSTRDPDAGGNFVAPTVLTDLPADSPLLHEEIFGPVLTLQVAATYQDCVRLANDTVFGLSASLYTSSLHFALRFAQESQTGLVKINQETSGVEFVAPFGGTKDSGFGTQEQGKAAREFFTHWQSVYIDHLDTVS